MLELLVGLIVMCSRFFARWKVPRATVYSSQVTHPITERASSATAWLAVQLLCTFTHAHNCRAMLPPHGNESW